MYGPAEELPPTYAVRPLVVVSIVRQVARNPAYALRVADIRAFERRHGRIPAGSVVMVRSDWSKRWTDDPVRARALAADPVFPGVGLDALKLLHLRRHILFHGHEPLDTDTTPDLEGEAWLLRNGYTQAEGVAHLDLVLLRVAVAAVDAEGVLDDLLAGLRREQLRHAGLEV